MEAKQRPKCRVYLGDTFIANLVNDVCTALAQEGLSAEADELSSRLADALRSTNRLHSISASDYITAFRIIDEYIDIY